MAFILIVDDDHEFARTASSYVRACTDDDPLILPINEAVVLQTIRDLHANVSLIIVGVNFPGDRGGLEILWQFNELFPIWCVSEEKKNIPPMKSKDRHASKLTLRFLLKRVGCQRMLFKPCSPDEMRSAFSSARRVVGGA